MAAYNPIRLGQTSTPSPPPSWLQRLRQKARKGYLAGSQAIGDAIGYYGTRGVQEGLRTYKTGMRAAGDWLGYQGATGYHAGKRGFLEGSRAAGDMAGYNLARGWQALRDATQAAATGPMAGHPFSALAPRPSPVAMPTASSAPVGGFPQVAGSPAFAPPPQPLRQVAPPPQPLRQVAPPPFVSGYATPSLGRFDRPTGMSDDDYRRFVATTFNEGLDWTARPKVDERLAPVLDESREILNRWQQLAGAPSPLAHTAAMGRKPYSGLAGAPDVGHYAASGRSYPSQPLFGPAEPDLAAAWNAKLQGYQAQADQRRQAEAQRELLANIMRQTPYTGNVFNREAAEFNAENRLLAREDAGEIVPDWARQEYLRRAPLAEYAKQAKAAPVFGWPGAWGPMSPGERPIDPRTGVTATGGPLSTWDMIPAETQEKIQQRSRLGFLPEGELAARRLMVQARAAGQPVPSYTNASLMAALMGGKGLTPDQRTAAFGWPPPDPAEAAKYNAMATIMASDMTPQAKTVAMKQFGRIWGGGMAGAGGAPSPFGGDPSDFDLNELMFDPTTNQPLPMEDAHARLINAGVPDATIERILAARYPDEWSSWQRSRRRTTEGYAKEKSLMSPLR